MQEPRIEEETLDEAIFVATLLTLQRLERSHFER